MMIDNMRIYSNKEIGEILGMPETKVEQTLWSALRKIRYALIKDKKKREYFKECLESLFEERSRLDSGGFGVGAINAAIDKTARF